MCRDLSRVRAPAAWVDWRLKAIVFPALSKRHGAKAVALCRDYLALSDEAAWKLGPLQFEAAAAALLRVRPDKATAIELLQHRRRDVRGRAILGCLRHAGEAWADEALAQAAPHALAYR